MQHREQTTRQNHQQNRKAKDHSRNHKDTREDKEVAKAIAEWKPANQRKRTADKRDKKGTPHKTPRIASAGWDNLTGEKAEEAC